MQNASGSLSKDCQAYYGQDAWKCIMAQYAGEMKRGRKQWPHSVR